MTKANGFWRRVGSAFERGDIDDGAAGPGPAEESARTTTTRYAPIREAVERRIGAFMRQELVSHLEIGFNEIFVLHYIEISPDARGAAELDRFLREFPPDSRIQWVKKLLGPALGQRVSAQQFLGLDKEFSSEVLAETDPFEEELQHGVRPMYRVTLHGRWESGVARSPAGASEPRQEGGPALRLSVRDAKDAEARVIEVSRFPAVVGSSARADVEISGYYASARHCTLHWDGRQLLLADHSTNGTWVDGERVSRGQRVAIANGALIGFGRDRGESEFDRYPAIHAHAVREDGATDNSATPVAPSASTPVAPGIAPRSERGTGGAPLATLAISDASGTPRQDVLKLPFTIGRGTAQDYVVPDANQGVSREHLVIESIDRRGAVAVNRAVSRNGTFAGTEELPERFVWRFGEEIVLGEKWTSAPAVRIALRPAGRDA